MLFVYFNWVLEDLVYYLPADAAIGLKHVGEFIKKTLRLYMLCALLGLTFRHRASSI